MDPTEGEVFPMRTTKQLSITLPGKMAEAVKERVAAGAYASESEVIRDGLRSLFAREEAIDNWLQSKVVASIKAIENDPSEPLSSEEMRAFLLGLKSKADTEEAS